MCHVFTWAGVPRAPNRKRKAEPAQEEAVKSKPRHTSKGRGKKSQKVLELTESGKEEILETDIPKSPSTPALDQEDTQAAHCAGAPMIARSSSSRGRKPTSKVKGLLESVNARVPPKQVL